MHGSVFPVREAGAKEQKSRSSGEDSYPALRAQTFVPPARRASVHANVNNHGRPVASRRE
jgi:hypothetical protein